MGGEPRDETAQESAVQSLRDWSKWLIGIEFGAGAGCVAIFVQSPTTVAVTPFLVAAIVVLGLSLGCSVLLLRELAVMTEQLPLRDDDDELTSIFIHEGETGFSIGGLANSQLVLLGVSAVFFIGWVVIKAITG